MFGAGMVAALARMIVDCLRDSDAGAEAIAMGGHVIVLLDTGLPLQPGLTVLHNARRALIARAI